MCLLTVFARFSHRKSLNSANCPQKQRFFKSWALPGCICVTYCRSDTWIGSNERSLCVDGPLILSATGIRTKMPKRFNFLKHGHIRDSQYPFESGAVGAFSCFTNTSLFKNCFPISWRVGRCRYFTLTLWLMFLMINRNV